MMKTKRKVCWFCEGQVKEQLHTFGGRFHAHNSCKNWYEEQHLKFKKPEPQSIVEVTTSTGIKSIINHDTKEYTCEDNRKAEDCINCHSDKADELMKKLEEQDELHMEHSGGHYPHAQSDIMNTLCPKHLYEFIY